ncbi:MAG TPA: HAD-IA family hydrolase [Bryobacteraceae bacterium]|nr:HAD-IA family hydrolase [Bryobacteraceae bacterium]
MEVKPLIVFDMDGVLVDVTESYRETIRRTVHHFTGREIDRELIQDYKNAGGWNNDWALSQKIIADLGCEVPYDSVVKQFQAIFFGENKDGLVLRERWIPQDGLLERLAASYHLAIFTGRLRWEAQFSLDRFVPSIPWTQIVGDDDVSNSKPDPDGLLIIIRSHPESKVFYVGDTVDDARAARAADVPFIGIAHRENPRHGELVNLLQQENAIAVLDNINQIESVL